MKRLSIALLAGVLAACGGNSGRIIPAATQQSVVELAPGNYIKHIVIIVQENRSFENMFAGWPGADAPMTGLTHTGQRVRLHRMTYAQDCYTVDSQPVCDFGHLWQQAIGDWDNGKMDGFDLENTGTVGNGPPGGTIPYAYMDHTEIAPYRTLASEYVLADKMFPTEFGTSFTAHQDLIAGTTQINSTHSLVNIPQPGGGSWGCDAYPGSFTQLVDKQRQISNNGPFPCFDQYATIADVLDAKHVSWKYYAPSPYAFAGLVWTAFDAIKNVRYGADWKNVVTPDTAVLNAPAKGELPDVSWVIPDLPWSDHPSTTDDEGPSWVGDVVDAIGHSKYWRSTAIVVLWDDWGGLYDNVPPKQLDYVGLGIRVPCIIISPYARKGYVSHTQYEFGSILKFIEETFGTKSLGTTDRRANSLVDSFDFTQSPRKFVTVPTKYPAKYFINSPQSREPPDND